MQNDAKRCKAMQSDAKQCIEALNAMQKLSSTMCNAMHAKSKQSKAMQCNAMQCNTMQCNAMQCNAMQCKAIQCKAMQCNAKQFGGFEDLGELGGFGDLGEPGPRVWGTRLEISNELDTSVDAPRAPRPGGTGAQRILGQLTGLLGGT